MAARTVITEHGPLEAHEPGEYIDRATGVRYMLRGILGSATEVHPGGYIQSYTGWPHKWPDLVPIPEGDS